MTDLFQALLRQLADLLLVGYTGSLGYPRELLDQLRRGGRLGDEAVGAVLIDGDHHGDDGSTLGLGRPGVERLAEVHDVDAVLPEGRPHRRCRGGLAGRDM